MKTIFRNQKTLKSAHIIPFFLLQEFTPTKINSKWIMDLSVKQKNIKILETKKKEKNFGSRSRQQVLRFDTKKHNP